MAEAPVRPPDLSAPEAAVAPVGYDAPRVEDLSRCVHCGFCLNFCPTYRALGLETESPRGRLHLIRALGDERIEPKGHVLRHLDLCLQCRACETACPSGVPFGRIMEGARAQAVSKGRAPLAWRLRLFVLRRLLPHRRRLRLAAALLRIYQRSGLQPFLRATGLLRLLGLQEADALLPRLPPRAFDRRGLVAGPADAPARKAALLSGCMMPFVYPQTHEATARLLARAGCQVWVPERQVCCGALLVHAGDRETARRLARRNIDAFLSLEPDAIIVNAAGCGSTMKEYGELLAADPEYAEKARRFSSLVRDITEFLADPTGVCLPMEPPAARLEQRVTYQDSCHLVHGQGVRSAPRALLSVVPGLELVEMEGADRCCGSAGIYNVTQREMSLRLLAEKVEAIRATGAGLVVTANPGCMLQIETGLRLHGVPGRVAHVVEVLDDAYRAAEEEVAP